MDNLGNSGTLTAQTNTKSPMKNKFSLLGIFCLLSACAYSQSNNTVKIKEISNLLYVDESKVVVDSLQRLNLVIPENYSNGPLFLWIGGGAWSYVNRHKEMDFARKLAEEGNIAVASVGHQLSAATWADPKRTTGVKHPTHVKDVAAAFKWLYDHATEYGYDRDKIFVGGYSSGAHLSAILSMDDRFMKEQGLSLSNIKGAIPVAGGYDIVYYHQTFLDSDEQKHLADQHVKAVFGDTEEDFINASPTSYADNVKVPMFLISENNTYEHTNKLEDVLKEKGFTDFQVLHVQQLDHAGLWKNISFAKYSPHRAAMIAYIKGLSESEESK